MQRILASRQAYRGLASTARAPNKTTDTIKKTAKNVAEAANKAGGNVLLKGLEGAEKVRDVAKDVAQDVSEEAKSSKEALKREKDPKGKVAAHR